MRESKIERHLVDLVKEAGGQIRKLRWIGRRGAPDRLILLPGKAIFVETKAPGGKPRPEQEREITRMRQAGLDVRVVASLEQAAEVLV